MKTMKKIFALALAMMMLFSLALTANAAAMPDTGSVTINGAAAGKTYSFYRIYDLESVGTNGGVIYITNEKWGTFGEGTYVTITDGHVTGMEGFTTAKAQEFAAAAIAAIDATKTVDKTADATASGDFVVEGLKYGYYVMKSTLGNADQYTVFTLFNSTPLEIDEKNTADIPKFDKSVHEDSAAEGAFGDSNTADVGEEITFKLTVTAAAGTDKYIITDTMTNLQFIKITGATVTSGGTSTKMTTNDYEFTATDDGFTIEFKDTFRNKLKDNDVVEITYTAKLTKDAIIDGNGNPNHAVLEYGVEDEDGNKPTKEDTTITKTYQITVNKTDDTTNAPLDGATFVLMKGNQYYKYDAATGEVTWVDSQADATPKTSENGGILTFVGIDADNNYTLVETVAPNGYVLPTEGKDVEVDSNETVTITNTLGDELPETGGMGTTLFYTLGGLMVAGAAVLMVLKKRQNAM